MSSSIDLDQGGQYLLVRFPYNPLIVEVVKGFHGRRWDASNKVWRVPVAHVDQLISTFMAYGFELSSEVTMLLAGTGTKTAPPRAARQTSPTLSEPVDPNTPNATPTVDALSISALNERVKGAVTGVFPRAVWVFGEVSDFDKNRDNRHIFFTLVEKRAGDTSITARVQVALFDRDAKRVLAKLGPGEMRDGIEIRVLARVDVYVQQGRYQLIIEDIDLAFTLGRLALEREKILQDLRAQGLERKNASLILKAPPLRVGVLCSLDSDGWNDFVRELERSRIGFSVTAHDVRVQGANVRPTMLAGLAWFEARAEEFDCICIIRGGGSRTDLAWFDDRDIAFAVARHPIKILCGIGHQRDVSVLDLISHAEKTPTAVAGHLIKEVEKVLRDLEQSARDLVESSRSRLQRATTSLVQKGAALRRVLHGRILSEHRSQGHLTTRLARAAVHAVEWAFESVQRRRERLLYLSRIRCERADARLNEAETRLRLLDPRSVLARGFVVVRDAQGHIKTNASSFHPGDMLTLRFRDGSVHARTETIEIESES